MNKIDLMDDKQKEKRKFEEEMLINKLKINIKDPEIHFHYLSCKKLTNEIKKHEDFQSYLKFLLTEGDENETDLLKFLQKKLTEDFNVDISKIAEETPNDEEKPKIIQKIRELYNEESNFSEFLSIDEYFNYSNLFDSLIPTLKDKENESNQYKNKVYDELFKDFNESFNNSMNKFILIIITYFIPV